MGFFSKDSKGNKKLGATIVAVLVIALVLLAGPASAFNVEWTVPSTIVKGNSTSITVEIQRNTNDVYAKNLTATVMNGSTTVSSTTTCSQIPIAGYGYGYLNKTKTESGYGYGYGYSYSYGSAIAGEGTITCTITFTPTTTGTHTIKLMNGSTILDTTNVSVSGSTGGGTTVTPGSGSTPTTTTEVVGSYTAVVSDLTEEELEEILSESNLTEEEINEYIEAIARGDVTVQRTLIVEKITTNGVVTYKSTFTLTFNNNTGKDLKDVKIVEIIPKEIATNATQISSTYDYKVLIEDPVLEFNIPTVNANKTATVTYSVNKQVTQAQFEAMDTPTAKYGEATTPIKEDKPDTTTDDKTDTTDDKKDTTTTPAQGMDLTLIIIVLIILIIVGIAYYKREDIKKMMK